MVTSKQQWRWSGAPGIISRSPKVEMCAPFIVVGALYIVAISILCQSWYLSNCTQAVVWIHNLKVSEVACFPKSIFSEMPGPHLGGRVGAVGPGIHHLAAPLHHGCMVCQVCKQLWRPVSH